MLVQVVVEVLVVATKDKQIANMKQAVLGGGKRMLSEQGRGCLQ